MKKVISCILITAFLFSTMEIALKIGGASFDSLQLTFLRFLIGGLVLVPLAIKEYHGISKADLVWLLLLGIMCIPISMLAFQLGVERCNASTAAAIMCLNPIFTMLIAHIFTTEKMSRYKLIAFCLGIIACVFLVRPWDVQEGNTVLGLGLMFTASVTFAGYTVMGKKTLARVGTFTQTSISFIFGSLVLLVIILFMGRPVFANVTAHIGTVAYVGIAITGIGYLTYFIAIKLSDATTGSIAFFIKPAIAPFLAVLILHETIMWNTIVGILLMLGASVLVIYDAKAKKQVATAYAGSAGSAVSTGSTGSAAGSSDSLESTASAGSSASAGSTGSAGSAGTSASAEPDLDELVIEEIVSEEIHLELDPEEFDSEVEAELEEELDSEELEAEIEEELEPEV